MKSTAKKHLEEIKTGLTRLSEGLEAKMQAFESESQTALQNLNKALKKIGDRVGGALQQDLDEAELQAHLGAMEARQDWDELKTKVEKAIHELSESTQGQLDAADLQAHLGYMEAVDRFAEKRQAWEKKSTKKASSRSSKRRWRPCETRSTDSSSFCLAKVTAPPYSGDATTSPVVRHETR